MTKTIAVRCDACGELFVGGAGDALADVRRAAAKNGWTKGRLQALPDICCKHPDLARPRHD